MRQIYDDDLIRIRFYGRKVKGLGAAEPVEMMLMRVHPSVLQVPAPFLKKIPDPG